MTKKQKKNLIKIITSGVLFVIAFFIPLSDDIKTILFLVAYIIIGYSIIYSAVRNIFRGQIFDENFLMSIATIGALFLREYHEAVLIMLLYQIGELFQDFAVGKSRRNIASLMDIRPETATVIRNNKEIVLPPNEVEIGEKILVKPGEKVPIDGVVIDGSTSVNVGALTGESLPKDITCGDKIISGSINLTGTVIIETKSIYDESTVAKILNLVENSSNKKAKTENFITRFARYYTPCVVCVAILLAVIPPILFLADWNTWIYRALLFLVVSCPCALVISVPLSFFGGIGGAAREGILVKGANYLETLSKVKTMVFDKTGTLTKGNFEVTAIHPEKMSKDELLDIAAVAESNSKHPIAESIINAHKGHIDKKRVGQVKEHPGFGVEAVIDENKIFVGNGRLMDRIGAKWHECHKTGTVIHIAMEKEYLGHIVISDEIKPYTHTTIFELKKLGIENTVMLTGDVKSVGESVGKEIGVDSVFSELLPEDKVNAVEEIMDTSKVLGFVGDGINDAPVISRADVGIAMGAIGSDAAIEAADIVIMDDNLLKLPKAITISRKTMKIVKENIAFALGVKAVILILGAVGIANMEMAIFADVGVMILAIINSMRTLKLSYR